jgi:hypothetical protein
MTVYRVTFPNSEPGQIVAAKKGFHAFVQQGLARIVETSMDRRQIVVDIERREFLEAAIKKYQGKYNIEEVQEAAQTPGHQVDMGEARSIKYLADQVTSLGAQNTELQGKVDNLSLESEVLKTENQSLRERLEASEKSSADIESIAVNYLKTQVSKFFELAAIFEGYQNRKELERILLVKNNTFIQYVNKVLKGEGMPVYTTELQLAKDIEKAGQKFEDLPENKELIENYNEAKELLDFLAKYRANEITNVPKRVLENAAKEYAAKEQEMCDAVKEHDEAKQLHEKKQRLQGRFTKLEAEYKAAQESASKLEEACKDKSIPLVSIASPDVYKLFLPITPEHKGLWLCQRLLSYAVEATQSQPNEGSAKLTCFDVQPANWANFPAQSIRLLPQYEFGDFGLMLDLMVVAHSSIPAPASQRKKMAEGFCSIGDVAKRVGKSYTYVAHKLIRAEKDKRIILQEVPKGKKTRYLVPITELQRIDALFKSSGSRKQPQKE